MKLKYFLYIIILQFFSPYVLLAQNEQLKIASIPIQLIENNKHILLKGKVNNGDTLTFYFDTGASTSLLDKESAKKLNIIPNYEQEVDGAGGKKSIKLCALPKIQTI